MHDYFPIARALSILINYKVYYQVYLLLPILISNTFVSLLIPDVKLFDSRRHKFKAAWGIDFKDTSWVFLDNFVTLFFSICIIFVSTKFN